MRKEVLVLLNCSLFQYCDSNNGLFPTASCKVIARNLFCFIFSISPLLLLFIALSIAIHTKNKQRD